MVTSDTMTATPTTNINFSDYDDSGLLLAVGQNRDRAAFAELYRRYEHAAHSLALHLTGSRSLAEDTLQEAMLRVWTSASSYRPGNARAWILCIVGRESLRTIRSKQRNNKENDSTIGGSESPTLRENLESLEHRETLAAVTHALEKLPQLERQIIALSYAAGLSSYEIAGELSISPRTVSYKISEILKRLKGELTKAGFAAALPLIGTERIGETILRGYTCAPGLAEKISNGIDRAESNPARQWSRRAPVPRRVTWLPFAAGTVIVAAAGAGLWSWMGTQPDRTAVNESSRADVQKNTSSSTVAALNARLWDFNSSDQAKDFKLMEGPWHFNPNGGRDGSGCMETESEYFGASIDFECPLPCLLSYECKPLPPAPNDEFLLSVGWDKLRHFGVFHNIDARTRRSVGAWYTVKAYISSTVIDIWTDGRRTNVFYAQPEADSRHVMVIRGNSRIDNVKVQSIRADEMPDSSAFVEAIEQIAPEKRQGVVVVPGLKSATRGQPVTIEFKK